MRRRLLISTGLIALVAVLVLGVPLGLVGSRLLRQRAEARLEREADAAAVVLGRRLRDGRRVDTGAVAALARPGHRLLVVLPGGRRFDPGPAVGHDPLSAEAARAGALRVIAFAPAIERTDDVGGVWLAVIVLSLPRRRPPRWRWHWCRPAVSRHRWSGSRPGAGRVARPGGQGRRAPDRGSLRSIAIGAALAAADRQVEEVLRREREFSRQRLASAADTADGPADAPRGAASPRAPRRPRWPRPTPPWPRRTGSWTRSSTSRRSPGDPRPSRCEYLTSREVVAEHVAAEWAPRFAAAGRGLTVSTRSRHSRAPLVPESARRQIVDVLLDNALSPRRRRDPASPSSPTASVWRPCACVTTAPGVPADRAERPVRARLVVA